MAIVARGNHPLRLMALSLAGALTLGGCATDGYGYGGVDVGTSYYGGDYYDPYYGPAGYGYGGYGGWYNDFYYPGGGYYVYDRGGRRHRWNDSQRAYWQQRHDGRRDGRPDGQPGRRYGWQPGQATPGRADGFRGDRFRRDGVRSDSARGDGARGDGTRSERPGGERRSWRDNAPGAVRPQQNQVRPESAPGVRQARPDPSVSPRAGWGRPGAGGQEGGGRSRGNGRARR